MKSPIAVNDSVIEGESSSSENTIPNCEDADYDAINETCCTSMLKQDSREQAKDMQDHCCTDEWHSNIIEKGIIVLQTNSAATISRASSISSNNCDKCQSDSLTSLINQSFNEEDTNNEKNSDYSTFAWTKAKRIRDSISCNGTVKSNDDNPCAKTSNIHERYSSAPSTWVSYYAGKRRVRPAETHRTDFALASESSFLFTKQNQPQFLFATPENQQQDGKEFIRLDQYHRQNKNCGGLSVASIALAQQEKRILQRTMLVHRIRRSALIGAFIGGLFAAVLLLIFPRFPNDFIEVWEDLFDQYIVSTKRQQFALHRVSLYGDISNYFNKLFYTKENSLEGDATRRSDTPIRRQGMGQGVLRELTYAESSTSSSSKNSNYSPLLVIAGKMTVAGGPCNIAQYDLDAGEWSLDERIQLSLYNSYSGGEVYSLLANYTNDPTSAGKTDESGPSGSRAAPASARVSTPKKQYGSGELIVVGAFDTTYRNSQVTYCSVGMWNGLQLSKVGEGLCNSALSKGMKITTASLAGPQDVYVAGSFQTQVWSGDRNEFVKIFNIAHFNAVEQVWLPLNVGQISCSWCTVTVLALAWDSKHRQLHIAGKFNAIDGRNVPAGLAIYDYDTGHLVAHPGGGLSMKNISQDGVGTALQLDEESGVLYVMGSFERLTQTYERCDGLAAYEIEANRWTCLADAAHTVYPTGGGNMLLTPFGLMVAGKTTPTTTWHDADRPYTIALLKATLKTRLTESTQQQNNEDSISSDIIGSTSTTKSDDNATNTTNTTLEQEQQQYHDFNWSWLPGFKGHEEPLHALTNGFGSYEGSVFIAGDNLVARWSYQPANKYPDEEDIPNTKPPQSIARGINETNSFLHSIFEDSAPTGTAQSAGNLSEINADNALLENDGMRRKLVALDSRYGSSTIIAAPPSPPKLIPVTEILSSDNVRGAIMAISQMMPKVPDDEIDSPSNSHGASGYNSVNITIIVYCVTVGCIIGVLGAILCNRNISGALFPFNSHEKDFKGFSLDTLTYSTMENTSIMEAYQRAMKTRYVHHPNLLTIIDPQEIFLQRIIGEGTFGRVWSAKWRTASVAVKEFVFAQAAVAGKSSQQQQIVEEIIGEAGMMSILRHPNVLQLFGCSLTAQAIWIVSELCSLGSLRQLLDDNERVLPVSLRLSLALQVAEGMTYLHNQVPPIIHRDLKSHNIFVHETFTETSDESSSKNRRKDGSEKMETHSTIVARIGDWGSARASLSGSRTMTHGVGTACWLAPEVIKHARSSKFSDVYGYGIVLWELATREEVYQGLETTQIIAKVANENLRPPVPKDCPWKDIMVKCWAENPHDRLEFHEIDAQLNDLLKRLQDSASSGASLTGSGSNASVS